MVVVGLDNLVAEQGGDWEKPRSCRSSPHPESNLQGLAPSWSKEKLPSLPFMPPTHTPSGIVGYCQRCF